MNKREIYKNRLDEHMTAVDVTPSLSYYGMFCRESTYLDSDAQKELRKDVRDRINSDECHIVVEGTNRKATYWCNEDAELVLRSYYTDVMSVDSEGNITKLWNGYSVTTMNHINKFLEELGMKTLSKHEWIMMDANEKTNKVCLDCKLFGECTQSKDFYDCMEFEEREV